MPRSIPTPRIPPSVGVIIAGRDERDLVGMGSAVMCAPGLALTAKHVVNEIFKHFQDCLPPEARGELTFGVQFGNRASAGNWQKWDVMGYALDNRLDIAALTLVPTDEDPTAEWPEGAHFSIRYQQVGESIVAYGFPGSRRALKTDGSTTMVLDPTETNGTVAEIYPQKRDDSMMPFPSMRTTAPFPAGISGGPVCDRHGRVFALVCSDMPPMHSDEEHISYASLIWPALGLVLVTEPVTGKPMEPTHLLEYARVGAARFDDHEWFEIHEQSDRRILRVRPPSATRTESAR